MSPAAPRGAPGLGHQPGGTRGGAPGLLQRTEPVLVAHLCLVPHQGGGGGGDSVAAKGHGGQARLRPRFRLLISGILLSLPNPAWANLSKWE